MNLSFSPGRHRLSAILCSLLLAVMASGVCLAGNQDQLLVVVQDGKYGFIDHTGKIVIPPHFLWALDFSNDLGTAYVCGRNVSIDSSGALFPLRVAEEGQLEPMRAGAKSGFVNATGEFEITPVFDDALPFSEGLAAVQVGDKWGFIDSAGRTAIKPQFDSAFYFQEGIGLVESDSGFALIDRSGKTLTSGLEYVDQIADGRVPASREGKSGYLDLQGNTAIPFVYE